ncbi:MAG: hypothetical protein ABSF95_16550 [Verrucomicrobiota bacterium]|jgi:hypothetical protein
MKSYLDNLAPFEKRLVVGVGVVLFVVFNAWFVVPHFSDWERVGFRREKAQKKLLLFNAEIEQLKTYKARIEQMKGEGYLVPAEDQVLHFATEVLTKAAQSGVSLSSFSRVTQRTNNQFFLEQSQTVTTTAKEQQLIAFLYNLGSSNSLIRVRDLGLRPDAPRQQLNANIKLVASYQKNLPVRAAPAAAARTAAAAYNRPITSTQ